MKNLAMVLVAFVVSGCSFAQAMTDFEISNEIQSAQIEQQSNPVLEVANLPTVQISNLGIHEMPIYIVAVEPSKEFYFVTIKPKPEGYSVSPQSGHASDLNAVLKTTIKQKTSFLNLKITEPKWMFKNRATEYHCG